MAMTPGLARVHHQLARGASQHNRARMRGHPLGSLRHRGQLRAVGDVVGNLARDDQVVPHIDSEATIPNNGSRNALCAGCQAREPISGSARPSSGPAPHLLRRSIDKCHALAR